LPSIYTEIMDELQSPNASIRKVGEIVAKDVGMTAKILQIVNSAFFGLRRHVADPAQAASFLGVDTLKSLVLSAHIFSQLDNVKIEGFCLETLWNHSAVTGALAKRIAAAEDCPEQTRDHALMAGLLHDAGKLVFAANRPVGYGKVLAAAGGDGLEIWEAERQALRNSHAEVGAYLFGLWGLPDPIVEAVAFHHCPRKCAGLSITPLTAVHAANAIAHEHDPRWRNSQVSRLDEDYLGQLGLIDRIPKWRELHAEIAQEEAAK
jgi:HD-like signal output (HDOD) protein